MRRDACGTLGSVPATVAPPGGTLRVPAQAVGLLGTSFLICVLLLEVHQPEAIPFKFGNLLVVGASVAVVLLTASWRASGALPPIHIAAHDWVYAAYLIWCLAGLAWSVALPQTVVLTLFLTAAWLATVSLSFIPTGDTIRMIFRLALATAVLSLAILPISPEYALQPDVPTGHMELRGIFDHQLRLGMMLCMAIGLVGIAIVNGAIDHLRGRLPRWTVFLGLLICVAALLFSRARGTSAALLLALMLCGLLSRNRLLAWASLAGCVLIILAFTLFGDAIAQMVFSNPSDATLSGRTLLWPKVIQLAEARPWTGYGYGSFYQPMFESFWRNYRPPSAHSSWLQAYFETGLPGLGLVVLLSISFIWSGLLISMTLRRISYTLFVGLFVMLVGLIDTVLAGKLNILTILMLLIAAQEAGELRDRQRVVGRGPAT